MAAVPVLLEKYPFRREQLAAIQGFWCGGADWEVEVSNWIRGVGLDSVLEYDELPDCQIWLYGTAEHGLVGFSSLKRTRWRWPTQADRAVTLSMIPMLGIQYQFRGQPHGESERRFADQILDDVIHEAMQHRERQPLLGLYVHPMNARAIAFYRRAGFTDFDKTWTNPETGLIYPSMLLDLHPPAREEAGSEDSK
jgi:ribosomal protein S18 acetylase RimI-like enzyme